MKERTKVSYSVWADGSLVENNLTYDDAYNVFNHECDGERTIKLYKDTTVFNASTGDVIDMYKEKIDEYDPVRETY